MIPKAVVRKLWRDGGRVGNPVKGCGTAADVSIVFALPYGQYYNFLLFALIVPTICVCVCVYLFRALLFSLLFAL